MKPSPTVSLTPAAAVQAAVSVGVGLILALSISRWSPVWPIAAAIGVGYLLLVVRRPDVGLLAALLIRSATDLSYSAFDGALVHPQVGALPNTGLLLTLTVAGGFFIIARGAPLFRLPGATLYALMLLAGLLSMIRMDRLLLSFREWLPVVNGLVTYALAAHLFRTWGSVKSAVRVFAASFVLPALVGFYQLATGQGQYSIDVAIGARIFGTFFHPNAFGLYLVVIFAVFLCQMLFEQGRWRLLSLSIVTAAVVLVLGTRTRVAWVGFAVVTVVAGVLRNRRLLVAAVLLAFAVIVVSPSVQYRLADPLGGSFADRIGIWQDLVGRWLVVTGQGGALAVATARLAGLGPGAVDVITPRRQNTGEPVAAHNDYLRVLVEYGVVGLVTFFALQVTMMVFAFKAWRQLRSGPPGSIALALLGLTVAYPIMSLTENVFAATQNQMYFWTIAGLTVAVCRLLPLATDHGSRMTEGRARAQRLSVHDSLPTHRD